MKFNVYIITNLIYKTIQRVDNKDLNNILNHANSAIERDYYLRIFNELKLFAQV